MYAAILSWQWTTHQHHRPMGVHNETLHWQIVWLCIMGRKGIAYVLDACPPSIWGNSLPEYAEQLHRGWSVGRLLWFDIPWPLLDMSHKLMVHGSVQYAARQGASSTLGLFTLRWLVDLVWKPDGMFVVSRMTRARLCGWLLSLWRASGISCITMISCKSQLATGAAWQSCRSDNV